MNLIFSGYCKIVVTALFLLCHQQLTDAFRYTRFPQFSAKRVLPLASTVSEESETASTLKIPADAWKFPPSWPFPADFLNRLEDYEPQSYDSSSDAAFLRHLGIYISSGDSILCIGNRATDETNVKKAFPSATFVDVEELASGLEPLEFTSGSFDAFVFYSGVELVESPVTLFREVCRVIKPKGQCFVCFTKNPRIPASIQPVQMWKTMTEEQKIWIAGSYFHYAATGIWENIEGYDVLSNTGSDEMKFERSEGPDQMTAFIVQCTKKALPDFEEVAGTGDLENAAEFMRCNLAGARHLDADAVLFVSYRLGANVIAGDHRLGQGDEVFQTYARKLSSIYSILKDVKEIVLPSPVKAMLAVSLLEKWNESAREIAALRSGLGLDPPSDEFWRPISACTSQIEPKDKIFFLADLVSACGSAENDPMLAQLPNLMEEALTLLEGKVSTIDASKRQTFVADLVVSDFLGAPAGAASAQRVLAFLQKASVEDLTAMITAATENKPESDSSSSSSSNDSSDASVDSTAGGE